MRLPFLDRYLAPVEDTEEQEVQEFILKIRLHRVERELQNLIEQELSGTETQSR